MFDCPACGTAFASPDTLKNHLEQKHPAYGKPPEVVGASVYLRACILLGGYGYDISPRSIRDLAFTDSHLFVVDGPQVEHSFSYGDLTNLELGGPGEKREGGGFIGGGVGLEGFVVGAVAADLLNALTTRKSVETVLGWQWDGGELIFLNSVDTPQNLRHRLSWVFGALRERENKSTAADPIERLKVLADLVERGLVTPAEFEDAKSRLLSEM